MDLIQSFIDRIPVIQVEVLGNVGNANFTVDTDDFLFEGSVKVSAPTYWPENKKCDRSNLVIDAGALEYYYIKDQEYTFDASELSRLDAAIAARVEIV